MKFIKLEILNLASLDRQDGEIISFEEGALGDSTIFSIVGPTGSGKSTILDAICLALYNRAPRYPRKKGDRNQNIEIYGEPEDGERNRLAPTDSRNILTRGKKEGYSKLTFLANNGNVYRAEWYVHKKVKKYDEAITSLYKLTTTDGIPSEETAEWNELPKIIGLDYDQFLRTVLIAQGSFANFLSAKENERYELLEKLIGCEELYTDIASKIKQKKDEISKAYELISANFSAQEKDIIPEEELSVLTLRISELEEQEKKAKEEIGKITELLNWYSTDEKFSEKIAKYEVEFNSAKTRLDTMKDQSERLSLHDATLPAVALLKDIKTAESKIVECNKNLSKPKMDIKNKEEQIRIETSKLENLTQALLKAKEEIELQKPRINKARKIKVEIDTAKRNADEKKRALAEAENADKKAKKELNDNENAIRKAKEELQIVSQKRATVEKNIDSRTKEIKEKLSRSVTLYDEEYAKLESKDATKLQEAKTKTEKMLNDIKEAIRIQSELKEKREAIKHKTNDIRGLVNSNDDINERLKTFDIEALQKEYDTISTSYTLMTSENWEKHRNDLVEGEPCPLCGSTQHPFHSKENVLPVIDNLKELVDWKRQNLEAKRKEKQNLTESLSKNLGKLDGMKKVLDEAEKNCAKLKETWSNIHDSYIVWPEDVTLLQGIEKDITEETNRATQALKDYNALSKKVDRLRKDKEAAEKEMQCFADESLKRKQDAEKKVQEANTALAKETGKTENLVNQSNEKSKALHLASEAYVQATKEVEGKTEALKIEIGDKDPDDYERSLNKAKDDADNSVKAKNNAISILREELKGLQGKDSTVKEQLDSEKEKLSSASQSLKDWLSDYNSGKDGQRLTDETISMIYSATDDWEGIRSRLKGLGNALTKAETTLSNEKTACQEHQTKKPEQSKDALTQRKAELSEMTYTELVDAKARLQRHNTAKQQMGNMFEQKQEAEILKKEWEEITDAIGSDGKTLRKIAQCYTLRFLIEHANVEIRKFNSRYELQQVKNSLGIRVIDHDRADDIRDTTSLSGGETFIVSLGLALGLSALSSRNISFENLFIDEGFGTLDPETLATVIDSLAMLQSSQGKKVGVISHTDTMSERITTQIRIIKNGNSGSSHIEIYP